MRKLVIVTLTLLFTAACSTHYKKAVVSPEGATFPGILALDSGERAVDPEVDLISVHGMCTHDVDGWVVEKATELADALDGVASAPEQIGDFNGLQLYLATVRSNSVGVTVNNFSFLWSPMTTPQKSSLCYDSSEQVGDCPAPTYEYKRASLNSELKSGLMNDCFSDAMIYVGQHGDAIRESFRAAIRAVGQRRQDRYVEPLFIITESLGSKIMTDALAGAPVLEALGVSEETNVLLPTRQVYMAANQLPLISLAVPPGAPDRSDFPATRFQYLNLFLQDQRRRTVGVTPFSGTDDPDPIGMVAFTDPNDLLSYGLPDDTAPQLVNVTISNDKTYFGYVENPLSAHTEYLGNPRVWELIIHGKE